jgi:hypothetical protein
MPVFQVCRLQLERRMPVSRPLPVPLRPAQSPDYRLRLLRLPARRRHRPNNK